MRDWVKPFLIQEMGKFGEWTKKKCTEEIERSEEAAYFRLICCLNCDFGIGGLSRPRDLFSNAFGLVLANLPKEVFDKLHGMKNLFFTFTPFPRAEVKTFVLEEDISEELHIVTFPHESAFMPIKALKGEIVHKLAHVYARHIPRLETDERGDEADKTPKRWGFEEEIRALRDYWKNMKSKETTK